MTKECLLCALLLPLPLAPQTFPTGDPVYSAATGVAQPLTPAEYRKFAAFAEGHPNIKVIRQLPQGSCRRISAD